MLLVSFGREEWARAWLAETGVPFPLLLDRERNVYRAYELEHSAVRTWNLRTLRYYLHRWLAGRMLRGIQGDPHQMGGDFVIDANGIVRFAYRSREPTDRPSVDTILAHVPTTEKE